jgi:dolichol-phosphate mannosyltransferase
MNVVVILPTYNERENIAPLVEDREREFARLPHDVRILVVDDNSPDGTADVVRKLQQQYANVSLIEGTRSGLGSAYIRGFDHSLRTFGPDVVFQMDADFSHKPEDLPRLMAEIDAGADFVIGSRYVEGGRIDARWGIWRRLNSRVGNLVACYVAGIRGVHDCTAGFRAIRATTLARIDLPALRVQGYAFMVALLHAAAISRAKIVEVPVHFVDRRHGVSKLGLSGIVEFILNAWWIRLQSSGLFAKFLVVGASGVVVNLGVFSLLLQNGVNKYLASPIAIEVSIISNYLLNNYWTFRQRKLKAGVRIRGLKFNVVSLLSLAVSYSAFVALSLAFPTVAPQVHQFLGIVPATLVNYLLNSYWTFRDERD